MRRASSCVAVLGLAVLALALPGAASAAPKVTFKAAAVPIAGFPHTGNIYGAGAAFESEFKIDGTEYGGFPPPLIHVNVYLPAGVKLHTTGFPTCPISTLEPAGEGPKACAKAKAGPVGSVEGFVAFGTEVVPEKATIESFYAPGGGLEFFTFGHSPVLLEILSSGHFVSSSGLYSKKFEAVVPLVETVPGANDASVKSIKVKTGSAIRHGKKVTYYGTLPTSCPKKYLPVKAELTFAGLGGLTEQTVTAEYKAPCPRKK